MRVIEREREIYIERASERMRKSQRERGSKSKRESERESTLVRETERGKVRELIGDVDDDRPKNVFDRFESIRFNLGFGAQIREIEGIFGLFRRPRNLKPEICEPTFISISIFLNPLQHATERVF